MSTQSHWKNLIRSISTTVIVAAIAASPAYAQSDLYYSHAEQGLFNDCSFILKKRIESNGQATTSDILSIPSCVFHYSMDYDQDRIYYTWENNNTGDIHYINLNDTTDTGSVTIGSNNGIFYIDSKRNRIFWSSGTTLKSKSLSTNDPEVVHTDFPSIFYTDSIVQLDGFFLLDPEERKISSWITDNSQGLRRQYLVIADILNDQLTNLRYFYFGEGNIGMQTVTFDDQKLYGVYGALLEGADVSIVSTDLANATAFAGDFPMTPPSPHTFDTLLDSVALGQQQNGNERIDVTIDRIYLEPVTNTLVWKQLSNHKTELFGFPITTAFIQDFRRIPIVNTLPFDPTNIVDLVTADLAGGEGIIGFADVYANLPEPQNLVAENAAANKPTANPKNRPSKGDQPSLWQMQRSKLSTFNITFNRRIKAAEKAAITIEVVNLGVNAPEDVDTIITIPAERIEFRRNEIIIDVFDIALPDGVYSITLTAPTLDGNGDGVPGDPIQFKGSLANGLFKYTGDWNGDSGTSIFDFSTFSYWFGDQGTDVPAHADLNGDGAVSIFDFGEFAARFGQQLVFPTQ